MAVKMKAAKKLAIFFSSIPRDRAVDILKNFSVYHLEEVAAEIRSLGTDVDKETQQQIFQEVADRVGQGLTVSGGDDVALHLLAGVVGEDQAREILERAIPKKPPPFSSISHVRAQDLATILSNEQPGTVSLILSYFPPRKTGEVLSFLEEDLREEVVIRLAQSRSVESEIVERIERIFVEKVLSMVAVNKEEEKIDKRLNGAEFMAEMFQAVDKELEEEMLNSIQEESEELANQIRDLMFTFEDIVKLSDPDIQKILRELPMDKLVLALRGASTDIYDKFTNNLSKRAKENLKEEMDMMGKVKKSQIDAERKTIVAIIRALEASGEIAISAGEDEDVYV